MRPIPNLCIPIQNKGEFVSIIDDPTIKDIIFSCIISGVKEAIQHKQKEATILEINSSGMYVSLDKDKWEPALNKTLEYFTSLEDYNTCIEIQELIKLTNSYGPKRPNTKTPRTNKSTNRSSKQSKN